MASHGQGFGKREGGQVGFRIGSVEILTFLGDKLPRRTVGCYTVFFDVLAEVSIDLAKGAFPTPEGAVPGDRITRFESRNAPAGGDDFS